MKPPFQLLIVHGDGSQVARFGVPRWLAYGVLVAGAVSAGSAAGLSQEWLRLTRERGEVIALRRQVGAQRVQIAGFEQRVATIRRDVDAWRAVHEDMWAALHPADDADAATTGGGVDGGRPSVLRIAPASPPRPLEQLDRLSGTIAAEEPRLRQLTGLVARLGELVRGLPLRWPVRGPVTSGFGRRRSPWDGRPERHGGIDVRAPHGTPVESPAAGTVIVAGAAGGLGKRVKLDHGNGVRSVYGHLSRIDVRPGQRVAKGQVIGLVGSTGRSTGPHLHYEVRVDGERVDPRVFLGDR